VRMLISSVRMENSNTVQSRITDERGLDKFHRRDTDDTERCLNLSLSSAPPRGESFVHKRVNS